MDKNLEQVLNWRLDLRSIYEMVPVGGRVFDLGCGTGEFLRLLKEKKNADVLGVEIDADKIADCIGNGVPVIQGDLDEEFSFAAPQSFDFVILSQTIQQVRNPEKLLRSIVRIGRRAAVSFINFGYWQCRMQLMLTGRMPQNSRMPYAWYNTPNIHFGTIADFRRLCQDENIRIVKEIPIGAALPFWPNLFAPGCVFQICSGEELREEK